jgi:hypothetical protein
MLEQETEITAKVFDWRLRATGRYRQQKNEDFL